MSKRFVRRGVSKILASPTVADKNNVSRAEIASAEDITERVAALAGWMLENNSVPVPDFGSTFDKSIPGSDSMPASSITFYEDLDEEDLEDLFPKGTETNILILRKGDKPGSNSLDCFPVRQASKSSEYSTGNEPARWSAKFDPTEEPGLDGPVPSAGPTITGIAPTGGLAAGGTNVTITGSGFTGTTGGNLGGAALGTFVVVNPTTITAVTAAHAAGTVPLTLVHPSGNVVKANAFTYV